MLRLSRAPLDLPALSAVRLVLRRGRRRMPGEIGGPVKRFAPYHHNGKATDPSMSTSVWSYVRPKYREFHVVARRKDDSLVSRVVFRLYHPKKRRRDQ